MIMSSEGVKCANDNVGNPELTQSLSFGAIFTAMMDISSDISNFDGQFMQFHGDHSKTNPIYGSWSNIYRKWRKLQVILSMMAENLSDFTANTEKLT